MTRIKITSQQRKGLKLNYVQHQAPQPPTASNSEGSDDKMTTNNDSSDNIESANGMRQKKYHIYRMIRRWTKQKPVNKYPKIKWFIAC